MAKDREFRKYVEIRYRRARFHALTPVIAAEAVETVELPAGLSVFDAAMSRNGADLRISSGGGDGESLIIRDFFTTDAPPELIDDSGGRIAGELAARMSSSSAPILVARASVGFDAEPIGRVDTLDGSVTVTRADGATMELSAGDVLLPGDRLETDASGAASLVLADDTVVSMGAESVIVLDEVLYDGATRSGSIHLTDASGVFVVVAGDIPLSDADAMIIDTALASVAVQGPQVGIRVDPSTGIHEVILMEDLGGDVRQVAVTGHGGRFDAVVLDTAHQMFGLPTDGAPVVGIAPDSAYIIDHYGDALAVIRSGVANTYGDIDLSAIATTFEAFETAAGSGDAGAAGDTGGNAGAAGDAAPDIPPINVSDAENVFAPAVAVSIPTVSATSTQDASSPGNLGGTVDHTAATDIVFTTTTPTTGNVSLLEGELGTVSTNEDSPTAPFPIDLAVIGSIGTLKVMSLNGESIVVDKPVTLSSGALVTLNSDDTFTYDPNGQFENLPFANITFDQFTFSIRDASRATVPATVQVAIEGVNDAPTAVNDTAVTSEDGVTNEFDPLANDFDVDDFDKLTLSEINGVDIDQDSSIVLPSGALVTALPNGNLLYDPRGEFEYLGLGETAIDTFNYTIEDGRGDTATAEIAVTINGEEDPQGVGIGANEKLVSSFEFTLGDFDSLGQVQRVQAYAEQEGEHRFFAPQDGERFALLTAEGQSFDRPSTGLTSFLNVDPDSGHNRQVFTDLDRSQPVDGAAMKTTITDLAAGDEISFWAAFDNRDFAQVGKNDLAVLTANGTAFKLFDGRGVDNPPALHRGSSDWTLFRYTVDDEGSVDLGFAVFDDDPDFRGDPYDSRLLVDDVRVNADLSGYTVVASDTTGALNIMGPDQNNG